VERAQVPVPSVSRERVARLYFGATFAIAAFSLGMQFVQDGLGVGTIPVPFRAVSVLLS